jgi:uncharacterized protein YlxP (DUF503 family)
MVVGVLQVTLDLLASDSLKDKRRVVKSLLARTRNRFNVAAAEVEAQDNHRTAVLAFACVSSEYGHAEQMLNAALAFVEGSRLEAEVSDYSIEINSAF